MTIDPISIPITDSLFVAGISWPDIGDIDLHVHEPAVITYTDFLPNIGVYYGYRIGNYGYLDQDITSTPGTDGEHYYSRSVADQLWTEEINTKYFDIRVANYSAITNQPFILALSSDHFIWDWDFDYRNYSMWGDFSSSADVRQRKFFSTRITDIGVPTYYDNLSKRYASIIVTDSNGNIPEIPPYATSVFVVKPESLFGGWVVGRIGSDRRSYNPSPPPSTPVARFTYSPLEPSIPGLNNVTFDASTSSISGGSIVSYYWDFGNGTTATGVNASTTYQSSGSYNVSLTVVSNSGVIAISTQQLVVKSVNRFEYVGVGSGSQSTVGHTIMDVPINITSLQGNELLFLVVAGYSENSPILWEADYQNGDIGSGWIEIGERVDLKYGTNTHYSLSVFCHINSGQTSTQLALINYPSYNFKVNAQVLAYENNGTAIYDSAQYATGPQLNLSIGSYSAYYTGRVFEIASLVGVSGILNTSSSSNGFIKRLNMTNTPATIVLDKAAEANVSSNYPIVSGGFERPWMVKTFKVG